MRRLLAWSLARSLDSPKHLCSSVVTTVSYRKQRLVGREAHFVPAACGKTDRGIIMRMFSGKVCSQRPRHLVSHLVWPLRGLFGIF